MVNPTLWLCWPYAKAAGRDDPQHAHSKERVSDPNLTPGTGPRGGHDAYFMKTPPYADPSGRAAHTIRQVEDALAHNRIALAFQPVVNAGSPERIGFYEGLIRITDANGRMIPEQDFMSLVEHTELGRALDTYALRLGLHALRQTPDLRLSINLAAQSIGCARWLRTLERGLAQDYTIAERLILEMTETSNMEQKEQIIRFMDHWAERGVCFALDDFGAGQTAMRYFKDYYFDILKIDGQFIRGIAEDFDNQALVRSMISIAQHFDMLTVAEYVENAADADMLRTLGVDCLQGYLFGAPQILDLSVGPARHLRVV